jgi:diguanylate cyclase (GGDEF)-like protein
MRLTGAAMLAQGLPAPWRVAVRALQGLVGAGAVLYMGSTLVLSPGANALDRWVSPAVGVGAGLLCLARAVLVRQARAAWAVLGLGLSLYAAGTIYWWRWVSPLEQPPYPSPADLLWLSFYPLAYVALVLLVRRRVQRLHASMWLDGLVGGLGAAALAAALAFRTILDATGGGGVAVAVGLSYPVADLLLLVLVIGGVALVGGRPDGALGLLGIGMVVFAAADTINLFRMATGTYQPGTPMDALWETAQTLVGLAAWQPSRLDRAKRPEGWAVLAVPSLFALSAIGVLVLGHFQPISTLAVVLATGTLLAVVVRTALTFREVRSLAESRRQALTDDLTGLGNRRLLYRQLEAALTQRAESRAVGLLILDLDRFKEVNDALGHHLGDQLLQQVGPRLAAQLRPDDLLARLGGDEFAILLADTDLASATGVAQRLLGALQEPFDLDGVALHVDASIGLALCPEHADTATTLLQRADVAMYQAKAGHHGWQPYAFGGQEQARDRLQTIEDLRGALAHDQLLLHYQPKIDPRTRRVVGVEALVRWAHPTHGLLYPDTFLPLAEQTGLMRQLTLVVLQTALQQGQAWRREGLDLPVAVNLSVANLLDAHLPRQVSDLLAGLGLPPRALELELTEDTLMADPVRSKQVLGELRALGVRLSVDDYGTGYSSLAYLQELAVDELKLDKSFVMCMTEDAGAAAIVRTTVDLAHSLGLTMVAEGVENQTALLELARLGCDLAQGYHISKPLPAEQLTGWLHTRIQPQPMRSDAAPVMGARPTDRASVPSRIDD